MSDVAKSKELLKRYSIARIPFIAINTIERARTLDILKEISEELSLPFYVHTLSKGLYDLTTEKVINDDKSVYGAIDYMSEQMKRKQYMTLVLTESPDLSTDNSDSRQILDLVTLANESGGVVIVLTNNAVWNQLQRQGMVIKIDLPNEDEMYAIIKEYIDDYRSEIPIEWDNTDIREAAATLAGVTRIEAENVIAALIANKCIRKADMDEIRNAKDRLFSDISGLEKIEVDESVKDVGGLEGLRRWLDEKKELLTPEKRDELKAIFSMANELGLMVTVHAEDDGIITEIGKGWKGTYKPADHALLRPASAEAAASSLSSYETAWTPGGTRNVFPISLSVIDTSKCADSIEASSRAHSPEPTIRTELMPSSLFMISVPMHLSNTRSFISVWILFENETAIRKSLSRADDAVPIRRAHSSPLRSCPCIVSSPKSGERIPDERRKSLSSAYCTE